MQEDIYAFPAVAAGNAGETCAGRGSRVALYAAGTPYQVTRLTRSALLGTAGSTVTGFKAAYLRGSVCVQQARTQQGAVSLASCSAIVCGEAIRQIGCDSGPLTPTTLASSADLASAKGGGSRCLHA